MSDTKNDTSTKSTDDGQPAAVLKGLEPANGFEDVLGSSALLKKVSVCARIFILQMGRRLTRIEIVKLELNV